MVAKCVGQTPRLALLAHLTRPRPPCHSVKPGINTINNLTFPIFRHGGLKNICRCLAKKPSPEPWHGTRKSSWLPAMATSDQSQWCCQQLGSAKKLRLFRDPNLPLLRAVRTSLEVVVSLVDSLPARPRTYGNHVGCGYGNHGGDEHHGDGLSPDG